MAATVLEVPAASTAPEGAGERSGRRGLARVVLGRADPPWVRPALYGILAATALLYLWVLGRNGTGNDYYAATVLSGTRDWKAAFFGSIDSANFITVDKPPLFLWPSVLAARAFGFSTWTVLGPQAAFGVATVAVLYATMRRSFGYAAGVLGAAMLALTPVAVAVNRWNIPDTLLVLVLVVAAAATLTAVRTGRVRWLLLAAVLVGLGFNVKMLQAWVVVPAVALAYLVCAPARPLRRIGHLALAGVVLMAVSSVWVLVTDVFVPADARPYVGGSNDDTTLELVLGHNGLSRIFGRGGGPAAEPQGRPAGGGGPGALPGATGPAGPGGTGGAAGPGGGNGPGSGANPFDEGPGPVRMFNADVGDQVSWLLPLALLAGSAGLALTWRRGRRDPRFAGFVLWLGWLAVHWFVFSFSGGIFHPYYVVQLAPAVAVLAAAGVVELWRRQRDSAVAAVVLACAAAVSVTWCVVLLGRTPQWLPWLRPVIVLLGLVGIGGWLVWRFAAPRAAAFGAAMAAAALVAVLLGPAAYATTPLSKATRDPSAGPEGAHTRTPGGAGPRGAPAPGGDGSDPTAHAPPAGAVPEGLVSFLSAQRHGETWLAAAESSMTAAPIILASGGEAVMTMGGFGGQDPAPTVSELAAHIRAGDVRFVLVRAPGQGPGSGAGGGGGPGGFRPGATGPAGGARNGPGPQTLSGPPGQPLGPGATGGAGPSAPGGPVSAARDAWVRDNCSRVDPEAYGGTSMGAVLYDCATP